MKKVLIVTKIGRNYGALLQAYALKTTFEKRGCNTMVLNYKLPGTERTYKAINKVHGPKSLVALFRALPRINKTRISISKCLDFRNKHFNLTNAYYNYNELKNHPPLADLYVSGSDQVWNPRINFDPAYYLLFGEKKTYRASYAASIGINEIPPNYQNEFEKRIKNFDSYSVREKKAAEILASLGIESEVHMDPTLLLVRQEYEDIAKTVPISGSYILLYCVSVPKNYKEIEERIRKLFPEKRIVSILGHSKNPKMGDIEISHAGPEEFVWLIKNADAVVTSSFHGTVFSIIFQKQFLSVLPQGTGSRVLNLLEELGAERQIVRECNDLCRLFEYIDYSAINDRLAYLQNRANSYIDTILGKLK